MNDFIWLEDKASANYWKLFQQEWIVVKMGKSDERICEFFDFC
jgi:hypothetical protein